MGMIWGAGRGVGRGSVGEQGERSRSRLSLIGPRVAPTAPAGERAWVPYPAGPTDPADPDADDGFGDLTDLDDLPDPDLDRTDLGGLGGSGLGGGAPSRGAAALDEVTPVRRLVPPRAALAALAVALALVLGAGVRAVWQQPEVVEVPAGRTVAQRSPAPGVGGAGPSPGAVPGSASRTAAAGTVVVDVVGAVRSPGLQRLPPGSRVADAVEAAGGAARGAALQQVNLARLLVDGEQVVVPGPGVRGPAPLAGGPAGGPAPAPGPAGAGAGSGGTVAPAAPVDLNLAGEAALDTLPGVGPVLAGRIVAWRTEHGRFTRVEELGEVAGIGPKVLERLRPLVRV